MSVNAFGDLLIIAGSIVGVITLVILVLSLGWVYSDAQSHGKTGCLWLLIAFFTWPFGVLAYYVLRDKPVQL